MLFLTKSKGIATKVHGIWFYCSPSVFGLDRKTCSLAHPHKKKWHEVRSGLGWGQFVFPLRPIHRSEKMLLTKTKTICHIEHCVDCPITVYNPVHNGISIACLHVQKHRSTCFSSLFQVLIAKETSVSIFCILNSYFPQF